MNEARQRLLVGGAPGRPGGPDADADTPSAQHVMALEEYLGVARERVAVGVEELEGLVVARLGLDPADPATEELLGDVELEVMEDPTSPVTMLGPDLVVHVPTLTGGIVLTHRLSEAERADEHIELDTDLAGFLRCPDPRVAAGQLHVDEPDEGDPVLWGGPRGWLADLPVGALLAVRVTVRGEVTITVLDAEPVPAPELVAALRGVYDAEVADSGLPVTAEELVLTLLHRDRAVFAEPRPPLTQLAEAAGLERRGDEFAHDESVWVAADAADQAVRLISGAGSEENGAAALEAFGLLVGDPHDLATLRRALDLLQEPDVLASVADELLEPEDDEEHVRAVAALGVRLVAAAGSSPRAALAGWFAAVGAERDGRVLDAESLLRAASLAADGWPLVEDRLAWYESDRGDAAAALGRWRSVEIPEDDPDVVAVRPFAAVVTREPGRNEPCWCGSGRKYKQCHIGRPVRALLHERAEWLHRKAAAYLERRGGAAEYALERCAEVLAGPDGDVEAAFDDPLVVDVVLHEGGWFERFLADRGPLLPADEAELGASWARVERTVYEVEGIRFGTGATVRDLRTGERMDVAAPTIGRSVTAGELLCGRAVPDGSTPDTPTPDARAQEEPGSGPVPSGRRLLGAVFGVRRGRERDLLALLDARDAAGLLEWRQNDR